MRAPRNRGLEGWKVRRSVDWLIGMAAAGMALCAVCGEYATRDFGAGGFAVTNTQANSVWQPSAALFRFSEPPTGTVTVSRVSRGIEYVLSAQNCAGASNAVWFADAAVYFRQGDVFKVDTGVGCGTAQVMQKAGE